MFDSMTDAFRDFSPHYDSHFGFLSNANDRLEKPYPDVSLHIYVQNSMANGDGEVVTEEFECSDGFPSDLQSSCKVLKKETVDSGAEEEKIETEIEQILEEVESELTNLEQAEGELPTEQAEGELEQAEEELAPEKETQPGFFDSLLSLFTSIGEEEPQAEEIAGPEVEPESTEESSETMEMHDCGHMMGNDDEFADRQIPFAPFQGLFQLLLDEPDPMRKELPSPSQDPFFNLFFPFKRYDQFDIQEQDSTASDMPQLEFVFPMNPMKRTQSVPTTTTLETEELYQSNFQEDTVFVRDNQLEGAILGTLLLILVFFGFKRFCRKTTCKEQCGEVEISTEDAKEMTELPKDFQEQLIATQPLEETTDVEDVDRPVTPHEVDSTK